MQRLHFVAVVIFYDGRGTFLRSLTFLMSPASVLNFVREIWRPAGAQHFSPENRHQW